MKNISILCSLLLAGCVVKPAPPEPVSSPLNIYQPSILALKAGTRVETKEGIYTPQTDEVWHSDKRYRELERQGY
jgi:hypothetical protein